MTFSHAPRGTCIEGCPLYGWCHCGCTRRTALWKHSTRYKEHRFNGQPSLYVASHNPHGGGNLVKNGIPIARVKIMVEFLHRQYGSWPAAARAVGVPPTTLRHYTHPNRKRIAPERAEMILAAVQRFRLPKRHALDIYEDGSVRRMDKKGYKRTQEYRTGT